MDVANIFVSIGVSDHAIGCDWWSTALGRGPDRRPMPSCCECDLPPPSGPVGLLVDYAHRRHIRVEVERSGTGGGIWR